MSKKFLTLGILLVVLAGVFVAPVDVSAMIMPASIDLPSPLNSIFQAFAKGIGLILITLSSLVLAISGLIFDWIVKFTIIDMAKNMNDPEGVGGSITTAWATLRDVANMFFIFVLLWTAFKAMFELNFASVGTAIKNIIIVALLINFSLFFSKVVIDASNIVAVGFYKSITANSAALGGSGRIGTTTEYKGSISAGYMNMLGIQTLFGSNILTGQTDAITILIIGFMSAVIMLIVAFILLIAGIMFAARFIILIFLMILSPLALIASIVPAMASHFTTWKDALISQSFFAPLYFAMTWVVFKLGKSLLVVLSDPGISQVAGADQVKVFSNIVSNPASSMAMLVNYVLIIGFSIAALVFSKMMASSTAGFSAITGAIGTGAMGGAALLARNTVGRVSGLISKKGRESMSKSGIGRAGLWLANKGKVASFDTRGIADTKLGKATGASNIMGVAGKAGGVGGFAKAVEDKAKEKAKYAKDVYGQTESEKEEIESKKTDKEEVARIHRERGIKATTADAEAQTAENARKADMTTKTTQEQTKYNQTKGDKTNKENEIRLATGDKKKKLEKELDGVVARLTAEKALLDEKKKEIEDNDTDYIELKKIADETREASQKAKTQKGKKDFDKDEYSKEIQDMEKAAEKRQENFAERTRSGSPVSTSTGAVIGGTTGALVGSLGGPIGTAIGVSVGSALGAALGKKLGDKIPSTNWAGNIASGRAIIKQAKGKSNNEKAADLLKDIKDAEDKAKGTTPPTPPAGGAQPNP